MIYSEYLNKNMNLNDLSLERKKQLKIIEQIRGSKVLVYAADMMKPISVMIDYSDLAPINDQLLSLNGDKIDLIIETPGGFGEVVEDIVKLVRGRFTNVSVIIPGYAKSAGTILAMSADEILMGSLSSLGPIDAQISASNGNKRYSADAFLEGLEKIKNEANAKNKIDLAYIPILQNISPGEIQHCENAQNFSRTLVREWLYQYKFKDWNTHLKSGEIVTEAQKKAKAKEIADQLCNHRRWLSHSKSLKISDLESLGLIINNYENNPALNEAILRYYYLLKMTFESSTYKIYETVNTQIYRQINQVAESKNNDIPIQSKPDNAFLEFKCNKCETVNNFQINFKEVKLMDGYLPFPKNNEYVCPKCKTKHNFLNLRRDIENKTKMKTL